MGMRLRGGSLQNKTCISRFLALFFPLLLLYQLQSIEQANSHIVIKYHHSIRQLEIKYQYYQLYIML